MELFEWWNFIFVLPLGVGLLFGFALALTGLAGDLGADHGTDAHDVGHDVAHDVSHDFAHEVDASHDWGHEVDHDIGDGEGDTAHAGAEHGAAPEGDHAHDADQDGHEHPLFLIFQLLSVFGIGRGAPLSVMLPLLMVVWGLSGLLLNGFLVPLLKQPMLFAPLSILASLFTTSFAGQGMAKLVRRYLREEKPGAIAKGGLVGCGGRAVFRITEEGGVANVKDPFGNIHRIVCRTPPGYPPIEADERILVVRYVPEESLYLVEEYPFGEELSQPRQQPDGIGEQIIEQQGGF